MLCSCPISFLCISVFVFLKILCCIQFYSAKLISDTMRMLGILENCNHVEISFILKVKIFLKPLLLLPLIFLLFPYSTPFPWDLTTHGGFCWRKLQWLIKRIVCLLWGAPWGPSGLHTEPFDPRKFISSRCFPHSHLSECPSSLCSIRINTEDPLLWCTVLLNGVWQGVDIWLSHWVLLALGTMTEKG